MSGIIDRIQEFTRPTGEEALMAVDYPTPRVRVGVKEAMVVAGILLIALVAWLMLRGDGAPVAGAAGEEQGATPPPGVLGAVAADSGAAGTAPHGAATGGTAASAGAAAGPGTTEPAEVVVSVVGEVQHPGLATLAPGSRVADALAVAEPLPGAELLSLNQAQKLNDGEQILVPAEGEEIPPAIGGEPASTGGATPGATSEVISLNSADAAELIELHGVGEKTAAAIISHREEIGGFTAVEQLQDVKGIGPAKFADLVDQVGL